MGQAIRIKDLPAVENCEFVEDSELVVVMVAAPRGMEEPVEGEAPEPTEPDVVCSVLSSIADGSSLVVGNSMPIRDLDSFGDLGANRNVRVFANRGASGIDGSGLKYLAELELTSLNLLSTRVSDRGLQAIGKFSKLQTLRVGKGGLSTVTSKGLAPIAQLKDLRTLIVTTLANNPMITITTINSINEKAFLRWPRKRR